MVATGAPLVPDRPVGAAPSPTDEALPLAQMVRALRTLMGATELEALRAAIGDLRDGVGRLTEILGDRSAKLDPEQLAFSADEAGKILHVSKSTIHKMTREGDLPTTLVGGVRRYAIDDLREFLARQRAYRALAAAEQIEREGGRTPLDPATRNAAIKDLAQDALERRRARRIGRRGEHGDGVVSIASARRRHASRAKGSE